MEDTYYVAFPRDSRPVKGLVLGVFLLETAQTLIAMHDAFVTFGVNFGDLDALAATHLSWFTVPIVSSLGA